MIKGREQSQADQKSFNPGKIALAHEHNWALVTSIVTSARRVARTSARCLGHPPRPVFFSDYLRWGWVFLERTRILSGIQFTTHFIEILVVETKRFVGSLVHVILTRQTCGQRSSKAAESKRRALGNYFFERIWYMFPISKCRGDWDLGLCTTSGLAYGEPQRNGRIRFFLRRNTFFSREVKEVRVSGW